MSGELGARILGEFVEVRLTEKVGHGGFTVPVVPRLNPQLPLFTLPSRGTNPNTSGRRWPSISVSMKTCNEPPLAGRDTHSRPSGTR